MELKQKLDKANRNISTLITEIVRLKRDEGKGFCKFPQKQLDGCNNNCDECRDLYFNELEQYLNNEFLVKAED